MLIIEAKTAGGPEVLLPTERPTPSPAAGEILLRQEAIGLNFIDAYHRMGRYPIDFPAVIGVEGAGVVEAIGDGVSRFQVGDRAAYAGPLGAYAQYRTL
ncbi:MAG: quinone oxidoreductase, partial [Caulobacteraceae bacterium]|nr:quinone oxidoreductase [Caulobacteraceae bacterium]